MYEYLIDCEQYYIRGCNAVQSGKGPPKFEKRTASISRVEAKVG
jgi:hypothetical protein